VKIAFATLLILPNLAVAHQTAEQKKLTVEWLTGLQDPNGGFYAVPRNPKSETKAAPSLRATNACVRALKYLVATVPDAEKHTAFVLKCYDPKTGGFADTPGGKPDVAATSAGVIVATELGIPHEKYAKAMHYLKENAKTLEDVRIGAAAVEAWGIKDCPFKLDEWQKIALVEGTPQLSGLWPNGEERMLGTLATIMRQLGQDQDYGSKKVAIGLHGGQLSDGGWMKPDARGSDIESTYRVMNAYHLLKEKPKDVARVRKFVNSHRNEDGGYAMKPGEKSSVEGTYYAVSLLMWLDEMEKK
jgi:prenyltransferase beta subunit